MDAESKPCGSASLDWDPDLDGTRTFPAFGKTWDVTFQGAKPDDTFEDRAAIQKSLDAAVAGDTIFFPIGKYLIAKAIAPKSGTHLIGSAGGIVELEYAGKAILASHGGGHRLHQLDIRDFIAPGFAIGISISNQPAKDYVYWGADVIRHASTWGMQMQGDSGGARQHYFYGNRFSSVPNDHPLALYPKQGHGLRFNGGCGNTVLDSNYIPDNGGAAFQWAGPLEGFTVTRNILAGNAAVSTGAFSGQDFEWSGNEVAGNGAAPASKGYAGRAWPRALFACPVSG